MLLLFVLQAAWSFQTNPATNALIVGAGTRTKLHSKKNPASSRRWLFQTLIPAFSLLRAPIAASASLPPFQFRDLFIPKADRPSPPPPSSPSSTSTPAIPIPRDLTLSSESYLLNLLPINENMSYGREFRNLQRLLEEVGPMSSCFDSSSPPKNDVYDTLKQHLSKIRSSLPTVLDLFSPLPPMHHRSEASTLSSINTSVRFEDLYDDLRCRVQNMMNIASTLKENESDCESQSQQIREELKQSLLSLGSIGELLIPQFPYEKPEREVFKVSERKRKTRKRKAKPFIYLLNRQSPSPSPSSSRNHSQLAARCSLYHI